MSREYWAEISKCSCNEEAYEQYKHLETLYLDYWKGRSILTVVNLSPTHLEQSKTEVNHPNKSGSSIGNYQVPKLVPPKTIRLVETDEKPKSLLRNQITARRTRRASVNILSDKQRNEFKSKLPNIVRKRTLNPVDLPQNTGSRFSTRHTMRSQSPKVCN